MAYELPKLDYAYNALEPFIDEMTMTFHHSKHHQTYVDNANKALLGTVLDGKGVDEVIKSLDKLPEPSRTAVRNNAGGHINHSMYWKVMAPNAGGSPQGDLGDAISRKFGSYEKFQELFSAAGTGRFGSGWAWLVLDKGALEITSTANQDTPLSEGKIPLLCMDVWEHAYYLKYQNRRAEYIKNWWNVVNWDYAAGIFKKALQ